MSKEQIKVTAPPQLSGETFAAKSLYKMAQSSNSSDSGFVTYPSGNFEMSSSSSGEGSFQFGGKVEGYDYEFVPPVEGHYECAICLMVLREPRQTPCGHRFCRACIEKWIRESKAPARCPVDNTPVSMKELFPDNFAKREIQNLTARCSNSKQGCDSIVTVKDMPVHLNECPFGLVLCPNRCAKLIMRRELDDHVAQHCEKRQVTCPDCGQQGVAVEFQNHVQSCPQGKLRCEHCKEDIIRQDMEKHQNEQCQQVEVACMFTPFGCETKVQRSQLDKHVCDSLVPHLSMLCQGMVNIMQVLGINQLNPQGPQSSSRNLTPTEISGMMSSLASHVQHLSIGVQQSQVDAMLSLPPMHTQSAAGISRSLDSSVAMKMAAAPAPHVPRTPSDPKYHLYTNQSPASMEASGFSHTSAPSDFAGAKMGAPSMPYMSYESEVSKAHDERLVVHQQSLLELQAKTETLERTLKQKIKFYDQQINELEGKICNGQYFWRIRNYSRFQKEAERGETTALHSHPFYTSPNGYKLCIRANLYGVDSARGSHLSLFIHFMQGENDDLLEWPFGGRIILSVMDQNECCELRNHVAETLTAKPNLAAFQRPTTPRNHKGFGYMEFLPLSILKNSTYIRNDTLIVKAHVLPSG